MPKTVAPRGEKGYVNGLAGWQNNWATTLDPFETNPELMWPHCIWTYMRMAREDARIASVLRAVGLPIRRTDWRISQNGASDEVTEFVANNLGLPIEGADPGKPSARMRDKFSWQEHLTQALTAQQFGHAVFEQVYRIEGSGSGARAVLRKLAPRPQSSLAYFNVARDGGLTSIQQWPAGNFSASGMYVQAPTMMGSAITVDRLVVYLRDADPGVWTGNSLLRPAYKHWKLKDELMRIEAAAARRNGIGVPVITGNEADSLDTDRMEELQRLASAYRGGENAGLALTEGEDIKIHGVSGNMPDLRSAIEYHDRQMGLVALAHFLNLDGKGGSYALASVQQDTFVQSVQTVADDIRDTAQAHVVEDIVDVNWGADEPAPRLVFDEIGSRQDATAAALQMLVTSGLLRPDARLEAFIREAAGLPGADPETTDDYKPAATSAPSMPSAPQARAKTNGAPTLW